MILGKINSSEISQASPYSSPKTKVRLFKVVCFWAVFNYVRNQKKCVDMIFCNVLCAATLYLSMFACPPDFFVFMCSFVDLTHVWKYNRTSHINFIYIFVHICL